MDPTPPSDPFTASIPTFSVFEGVADTRNYKPLPADWALAISDIVGSTGAITEGNYKSVNMAGASMITAMLNELGRPDLPFVFGGDGAVVAFPLSMREAATRALASTQAWVADALSLTLRAAIVPLADIRRQGLDVRVALFRASEHVSYAMLTGGGTSWAEAEMKAGRFGIEPGPHGSRPDLTGLSCRWNPIEAHRGDIVSIIAVPAGSGSEAAFRALVADIVEITGEQERGAHPIPAAGPDIALSLAGVEREVLAVAPPGRTLGTRLSIIGQIVLTYVLAKLGVRLGRFSASEYAREVSDNSDFRKFDDGLKMTVDIDEPTLERIEKRLTTAERAGVCRFGIHRQKSALMTCIVMTPLDHDHIHFVDGASGGYAMAAANLKAKATPSA